LTLAERAPYNHRAAWVSCGVGMKRGTWFSRFGALAAIAVASLVLCHQAHAVTIYTYTGKNFTTIQDAPLPAGTYTTSSHLSGFFKIASPLAPNTTTSISQFLGISFTDGRNVIDQSNLELFPVAPLFSITTDASAKIIAWQIVLNTPGAFVDGPQWSFWSFGGDAGVAFVADEAFLNVCLAVIQGNVCSVGYDEAQNRGLPGSWTASTIPNPTPLPASLPLFVGGLGTIGWLTRRRSRKTLKA
jgi:hypothetical protein